MGVPLYFEVYVHVDLDLLYKYMLKVLLSGCKVP